jgi:hypothetical protein
MAFGDGMVFIVGGAGYVEYGNLEEWANRTGKRVTYGGTDIVDPGGFVTILEGLGKSGANWVDSMSSIGWALFVFNNF